MNQCSKNPVIKFIRIILSLFVIGLGIYYKNWLGLIGIFTLISAFTGSCPLTINLNRKSQLP
ncbi:MAG: DUF2892 domain-containing protein [Candidatus Aminicenantes bacterium]|nr:DUF2892 domain-containing protein [Candidatus Aminicenantes bacterium]